jgi:hypothetical protein
MSDSRCKFLFIEGAAQRQFGPSRIADFWPTSPEAAGFSLPPLFSRTLLKKKVAGHETFAGFFRLNL